MDERIILDFLKANYKNGASPSKLRTFCKEHNFPAEFVDDAISEIDRQWKHSIGFSIGMLSSWDRFDQANRSLQSSLRDMKEWNLGKRNIINLLIGIYIGVVGNIFVSFLMMGRLDIGFLICLVLFVVPVVYYIENFLWMRSKDKEYENFVKENIANFNESMENIEKRAKEFGFPLKF